MVSGFLHEVISYRLFVGYLDTKLIFIRTILKDVTVMKRPKKFLSELNHLNLP